MTRPALPHPTAYLLAFALLFSGGCGPKTPPATTPAAAAPAVAAPPQPASEPLESEEFARRRAALLRAEDLRLVDEAVREAAVSADPALRALAYRALGRIGGDAAVAILRAGLADPFAEARVEAVIGVGYAERPSLLPSLAAAADDPDPAVRAAAALALGFQPGSEAAPKVAELLEDLDAGVVAAATVAATRLESAGFAVTPLIRLLADERPGVAPAALYALSRLSARRGGLDLAARKTAREALVRLAEAELPVGYQVLVAQGLRIPENAEQLAVLDGLYASDDYRVRVAVLEALTFPGSPVEPFLKALGDEDQRVLLTAVRAAPRVASAAFLTPLLNLTIHDDRDWLRAMAVDSMARLAPDETAQMVNGLSRDGDPGVRLASAYALVGRTDDDAMIFANRLLADPDPRVRGAAAAALVGSNDDLALLFEPLAGDGALPVLEGRVRAAGLRLADQGRSAEAIADALAQLDVVWNMSEDVGLRRLILDAAAQGPANDATRGLLERGLNDPAHLIRQGAVAGMRAVFGLDQSDRLGLPSDRTLEDYRRIVDWASRPRAALVTVERPGSGTGVFSLQLDTERSPLAAWSFSQLADSGYFRGAPLDPVPNRRLGVEDPEDRLGPGYALRDEPAAVSFSPGTAVLTRPAPDAAGAAWFVTLAPSPGLIGTHTAFATVVRNLEGVVSRCLPGDRIGTVHVYEGDGSEELPPVELIP